MAATCSNIVPVAKLDCPTGPEITRTPKGVLSGVLCDMVPNATKTDWKFSIKTGNLWQPVVEMFVRGVRVQMELSVGDVVTVDFEKSTITKGAAE